MHKDFLIHVQPCVRARSTDLEKLIPGWKKVINESRDTGNRSEDTKGMPETSRSGHQYRFLSAGQLVASNDGTAASELLNASRFFRLIPHALLRRGNSVALPQALQATRGVHIHPPRLTSLSSGRNCDNFTPMNELLEVRSWMDEISRVSPGCNSISDRAPAILSFATAVII